MNEDDLIYADPDIRGNDVIAGADFSDPPPGVHLSSAQLWGRLLRMTQEERTKFLDMMQEAATAGVTCRAMDHGERLLDTVNLAAQWSNTAIAYRVAAVAQQAEAEEWHNRFKRVLRLAHEWRAKAQQYLVDRDMRAAGVDGGEEPSGG